MSGELDPDELDQLFKMLDALDGKPAVPQRDPRMAIKSKQDQIKARYEDEIQKDIDQADGNVDPYEQAAAFGQGMADNLSLGLADEAKGVFRAITGLTDAGGGTWDNIVKNYEQGRDEQRADVAAAQEAMPGAYGGGGLAGTAAGLVTPGKIAMSGAATRLGSAAKGAATGGAFGATGGFGSGEGLEGSVVGAAQGAALGGVLGGAAGAAAGRPPAHYRPKEAPLLDLAGLKNSLKDVPGAVSGGLPGKAKALFNAVKNIRPKAPEVPQTYRRTNPHGPRPKELDAYTGPIDWSEPLAVGLSDDISPPSNVRMPLPGVTKWSEGATSGLQLAASRPGARPRTTAHTPIVRDVDPTPPAAAPEAPPPTATSSQVPEVSNVDKPPTPLTTDDRLIDLSQRLEEKGMDPSEFKSIQEMERELENFQPHNTELLGKIDDIAADFQSRRTAGLSGNSESVGRPPAEWPANVLHLPLRKKLPHIKGGSSIVDASQLPKPPAPEVSAPHDQPSVVGFKKPRRKTGAMAAPSPVVKVAPDNGLRSLADLRAEAEGVLVEDRKST